MPRTYYVIARTANASARQRAEALYLTLKENEASPQ
jgi:hypothetical protein